jgi:hypothetical protein
VGSGNTGSSSNQSSHQRHDGRDLSRGTNADPALDNVTSSSIPTSQPHHAKRVRIVL